eukprot:scaffold80108_cov44-Attheya_sp.AAC.2
MTTARARAPAPAALGNNLSKSNNLTMPKLKIGAKQKRLIIMAATEAGEILLLDVVVVVSPSGGGAFFPAKLPANTKTAAGK